MSETYVYKQIPTAQIQQMRDAINYLIPAGAAYEVRLLAEGFVASGIFAQDGTDAFVRALQDYHTWGDNATRAAKAQMHITLQQLTPDVLSMSQRNHFVKGASTIKAEDVTAYNWLIIDLDPVRRAGISSNDTELEYAHSKAQLITQELSELGWGLGYVAMSGNGYHIGYRADIAVTPDNTAKIKQFYDILANRYSDSTVTLDSSFASPAQLSKLYGSKAQKGSNDAEHGRVHRWSQFVYRADTLVHHKIDMVDSVIQTWGVSINQLPLSSAASPVTPSVTSPVTVQTPTHKMDVSAAEMQQIIDVKGIPVKKHTVTADQYKWTLDCPICGGKDKAVLMVLQNGVKCYKCQRESCPSKSAASGWAALKEHYHINVREICHHKETKTRAIADGTETKPSKDVKPVGRRLTLTRQYVEQYLIMTNRTIGMDILQNRIRFDGFSVKVQRTMLDTCADMIVDDLVDDGQQDRVLCTGIAVNCGRDATVPDYDEHGKQCGERPVEYVFSGVNKNRVCDLIMDIAHNNPVNPILDKIQSVTWDGTDRLQQWYDMWHIDDDLSRTLIRKWSMQAICALHNAYNTNGDNYNLDLVLVLDGEQGIGKTTFFRHLAMMDDYFADGVTLNPRDTDSVMQATSKWIVELGEIGSTFKSDLDALKGFLSKSIDEYRSPYARQATICPRHTVFCGSVNGDDYLIDGTGNRRFATIRIADDVRVDVNTMHKTFDSLQYWAQIYSIIEQDVANGKTYGNCFRLTAEEHRQLAVRNSNHRKMDKGESELLDIMDVSARYIWRDMTVTEFLAEHDGLRNAHITATQLSKLLKRHGYLQLSKRTTNARLYYLPTSTIAPQQTPVIYPVPLPAGQTYNNTNT